MTETPPENTETVQNAELVGDPPAGKPAPKKRAAKKSAAKTSRAPSKLPDGLDAAGYKESSNVDVDELPTVHYFEFDNGLGAKVYQSPGSEQWTWAPTRDGRVLRSLPGLLIKTPATGSTAEVSAGLLAVSSLK